MAPQPSHCLYVPSGERRHLLLLSPTWSARAALAPSLHDVLIGNSASKRRTTLSLLFLLGASEQSHINR